MTMALMQMQQTKTLLTAFHHALMRDQLEATHVLLEPGASSAKLIALGKLRFTIVLRREDTIVSHTS